MPIKYEDRILKEDLYIDYEFEEVMFRREYETGHIYVKFYGECEKGEIIHHSQRLFNDAILYGEKITKEEYGKGKTPKKGNMEEIEAKKEANTKTIEFKKNNILPIFQVFTFLFLLVTLLGFHQMNYTIPNERIDRQAFYIFTVAVFPTVLSLGVYIIITSTKYLKISPKAIIQVKNKIWRDSVAEISVSDIQEISLKSGLATGIILSLKNGKYYKIETMGLDISSVELSLINFTDKMPNNPNSKRAHQIAYNISLITSIPFRTEYIAE